MISDEEYANLLKTPGLAKKYREEVTPLRQGLKPKIKEENKKLHQIHFDEIRTSESHDQLVSMSIFPFLQGTAAKKLGYQLVRCAPLLELDVKNLDFLIYRKDGKKPIAIFGEAKSSIAQPSRVIQEFQKRKTLVEQNRKYILENYLHTKDDVIFEYVLSVFSRDAIAMKTELEKSNEDIILWSADLGLVDLSLVGHKNSLARNILHHDQDLCRVINGLQTSLKTPIHFVQSHIVVRMRSLIITKESASAIAGTKNQKFKKDDLDDYFRKLLYYLPKTKQEEERDYMLDTAEKVGLIKRFGDECMIQTNAKGVKGQTKEFENAWIAKILKKNTEEKVLKPIDQLRQKYTDLDNRQGNLEGYF